MSFSKKCINDLSIICKRYRLYLLISAFYVFLAIVSKYFYDSVLKCRTDESLKTHSDMIYSHTFEKVAEILGKKDFINNNSNKKITIEKSDIVICNESKCTKENLLDFSALLDRYLPEYIYYKITLNESPLHRNTKLDSYQLTRYFNINDNEVVISASLSPMYLDLLKRQTAKPFIISFLFSTLTVGLLVLFHIFTTRSFDTVYSKKYNSKYTRDLKLITEKLTKKFDAKESHLMQKIWNLEYSKNKEKEFNNLFSKKANQIAEYIYNKEFNSNAIIPLRAINYMIS